MTNLLLLASVNALKSAHSNSSSNTLCTLKCTDNENFMDVDKEKLLWKYIDRECSPAEEKVVNKLLESDPAMRREYEQMLEMHYDFIDYFRVNPTDISKTKDSKQ